MTLRIRKLEEQKLTIIALSGRIEEQHLSELQQLVKTEAGVQDVVVDLEEVRLVDRGAVRFLADCESKGIKLRNCPAYIREWLDTGRGASHES